MQMVAQVFFFEFPSFVQIGNKLLHLEGRMFEHHEGNEGFNRIGIVLNHWEILIRVLRRTADSLFYPAALPKQRFRLFLGLGLRSGLWDDEIATKQKQIHLAILRYKKERWNSSGADPTTVWDSMGNVTSKVQSRRKKQKKKEEEEREKRAEEGGGMTHEWRMRRKTWREGVGEFNECGRRREERVVTVLLSFVVAREVCNSLSSELNSRRGSADRFLLLSGWLVDPFAVQEGRDLCKRKWIRFRIRVRNPTKKRWETDQDGTQRLGTWCIRFWAGLHSQSGRSASTHKWFSTIAAKGLAPDRNSFSLLSSCCITTRSSFFLNYGPERESSRERGPDR